MRFAYILLLVLPPLSVDACAGEECALSAVQLLQSDLSFHDGKELDFDDGKELGESRALLQRRKSFPLEWYHVPKCGSSLGNAILTAPGACPGLPDDIDLADFQTATVNCEHCDASEDRRLQYGTGDCKVCDDSNVGKKEPKTVGQSMLRYFSYVAYPDWEERCPGLTNVGDFFGQHVGVKAEEHGSSHVVTMLRHPSDRIISQYKQHLCMEEFTEAEWPITRYAKEAAGCYTRTMTREVRVTPFDSGNCRPPQLQTEVEPVDDSALTRADVELAKRRVEDFAYVGLTEEWPRSMCLWSATFGGPCRSAMFTNVRPAESVADNLACTQFANSTDLGGFVDKDDYEIYDVAVRLFWSRLKHVLEADPEACERCYAEASVFVEDDGITYVKL